MALAASQPQTTSVPLLDKATLRALAGATLRDSFAVLGPHGEERDRHVRAYLPGARAVRLIDRANGDVLGELGQLQTEGLYVGCESTGRPYLLWIEWADGVTLGEDPYSFRPLLGDIDLHLIAEGKHLRLATALGAHWMLVEGVAGVRFCVWAPNAQRVSVVGDFNAWDERRHGMRLRHEAGVWEIFIPRLEPGARYKFAVVGHDGVRRLKADPMARRAEPPPLTASIVAPTMDHAWRDKAWMASRAARHKPEAPISIYEVHAGSWLKPGGEEPSWRMLTEKLIPYVSMLGFSHIELLPIAEHPFGGSWGYQPVSLYAPTGRLGDARDFAAFVDACHDANIGVILDWTPGHFPDDPHGLARFDGTALYEHEDPREGRHPHWNTLLNNLGRREVRGFLAANALYWIEEFHVDGLRVDAVASMLYRDYGRAEGQWFPNAYGGRENLEAIAFLRNVNGLVATHAPDVMMIAEESTAWPGVTESLEKGGLGFTYKWNMGWMNDTLRYFARDPIHRRWHHDEITFGLVYAFAEKFVLALSHDEVVHGKRALAGKMPGDAAARRAQLRVLFALMWTHPGKKLVFMGGEFAQEREWNHDGELDWSLIETPVHSGMLALMRDLNHVYRRECALFECDARPEGFRWIVVDDRERSVFAFLRLGKDDARPILVVVNATPVPRTNYVIGAPRGGFWSEILNTDSMVYGGGNGGNFGGAMALGPPAHGEAQSLELYLPPFSAILMRSESIA